MNSIQRVLSALSFKEPDRVPLFLALTMHGAKELGLSQKDYFSNPEYVFEGQVLIQKKYANDFFYAFYYAPLEIEILGGEVFKSEDGPTNSGNPVLRNLNDIKNFSFPKINKTKRLLDVLKTIKLLKQHSKDEVPIVGVAMSPFSLPVMQMGFDKYIDLIYENKILFNKLIEKNAEFCIDYANAQLDAGATAVCYFDPVSSNTIINRELFIETGFRIAKETIKKIKGPVVMHFASGRCEKIIDLLPETGCAMIGVSIMDNLEKLKNSTYGKISIAGNLNGIEMRNWTLKETEEIVKKTIGNGAPGGGFILSDNHGEIPFQVPEEVLLKISETVQKFGNYPINL